MPKTEVKDIHWCPVHQAIDTQCCGHTKEKIGFMEVIDDV